MDTPTPSAKEQLEDIIIMLANAWVQKLPRHEAVNEKEINRLLSLSLRTVYELVAKGILKELPAGSTPFIQKGWLLRLIMPEEVPVPPKPTWVPLPPPPLTDEVTGKTFIQGWLYKLRGFTKNDHRLHEVLQWVLPNHPYMEDITEKEFFKHSRSRLLWEFFIKKRGY